MLLAIVSAVLDVLEGDPALAERARKALGLCPSDEWLSLARAASYAGLDPESGARVISDDARRGRIALGHAGRAPVVRRSEIDRWIEARGAKRRDDKPADEPRAEAQTAVARAAARWAK